MLRRSLLLTPLAFAQSPKPREWVTAAASRDTAPRVALIPSNFAGGVELDDRKIRPLAHPAPLNAPLSPAQLDDMFRLAVELGGGRRGGLSTAIAHDDWVLIQVAPQTPPSLTQSLLKFLTQNRLGIRHTLFDPASAQWLEMPVEGRAFNTKNPTGLYKIPRVLRECDKLISLAPLSTHPQASVALTFLNYLSFCPNPPGDPALAALDIFSFHPADYAVLAPSPNPLHNILIAGNNATAVDSVGAALLGLDSTAIPHLELAAQRGYGINDAYSIWTRGEEISEVKLTNR
jgi:hypothetical protein